MLVSGLVRLIRDPESRQAGASSVCKFTVVENKKYKDKESATFVDVEAWGRQGEVIQERFVKGNRIYIVGTLEQQNWEKDGEKKSKLAVKLTDFQFVDAASKTSSDNDSGDTPPQSSNKGGEDIPF